jgi:PAS domain S-box-containing protein
MKEWSSDSDETSTKLRNRAEQILLRDLSSTPDPSELTPIEIRALVHNLQVQQIELEVQNDELRRTQEALETSRDRYSDLFDFAPVGYFTLDREKRILEANLTASQLLQIERSALIGKGFSWFVAPEGMDHFHHLWRRLLLDRWLVGDDIIMRRANGETLPVQLSGSSTTDDGAGEIHIAVTDISERKLLEERRDLFFSIASHELRTPVTSLTLALDMLANSDTSQFNPDQRTMLETAGAGARRLQRLVGEILEMRRIDGGAMEYRTQVVALAPLVSEAVAQCRALATGCEASLELRESLWDPWVDVDSDRLMQVLFNLMSNALRYSPLDGTVVIESTQAGEQVRVSVTDTGPGIAPEFRDHVFEPFAQADPSLEDGANGQHLGLGLNIAKNIVQRFGGHIGFTSEPHVATTFYFELPLHPCPE